MNDRRRGLGRGLGSLIPTGPEGAEAPALSPASAPVPARRLPLGEVYRPEEQEEPEESSEMFHVEPKLVAGAYFAELPLTSIVPNARQPREYFDEDELAELGQSIREVGLLQPIVVRKTAEDKYELIMGERRFRASQSIGLAEIPAIVRQTEDERMLLDALLENMQRAQLNPLEEAAAFDQLLKDFRCTHDELASKVGRSRAYISNTLRLLRLSPSVQVKISAGTVSAGHAKALCSLETHQAQEEIAQRIIAEGLSVRTVEEIVQTYGAERPRKQRKARAGSRIAPEVTELAGRLSDRYETRVTVNVGGRIGKVVVEFGSIEDLDRILEMIAPGERVRSTE
ncbi:ParB/RepB/Spo0J family partition protein [Actinospica durhamensis]|uniref:ParB/RepB/Spo0J family partition protein n=1 Tax=Actinospica durhamensis TaxID=1508375 RepID=A0A941ENT5_9ACTN|nr:ParB/RepB/Spo0J family partition protein [Actinospica durhamensis]MBR7834353.1 ParB/RepB/Spo0J family partition protein [Actinospica durhamensis]